MSRCHQSCIRHQIEAFICAVPTADAAATDEVNCYNCIGHSQGFRKRSARGTVAQRNDPWRVKMELRRTQQPVLLQMKV